MTGRHYIIGMVVAFVVVLVLYLFAPHVLASWLLTLDSWGTRLP